MSYQDRWGRFHHKPCVYGEPSSNNGWLYTAYAKKAGVPVDMQTLGQCFNECRVDSSTLLRSPGKATPPMSRDEILGMVALGVLKPMNGVAISWNFSPYPLPRFSLIKLVKQLWDLRPEVSFEFNKNAKYFFNYWISFRHRNYFWQNNLDQIYRFAFSVPVVDRHFILKSWGKFQWYNPAHVFYAAVAKVDSTLGQDSGIRYLKYGKSAEAMVKEFPEDHDIRQRVRL